METRLNCGSLRRQWVYRRLWKFKDRHKCFHTQ